MYGIGIDIPSDFFAFLWSGKIIAVRFCTFLWSNFYILPVAKQTQETQAIPPFWWDGLCLFYLLFHCCRRADVGDFHVWRDAIFEPEE